VRVFDDWWGWRGLRGKEGWGGRGTALASNLVSLHFSRMGVPNAET